MSYSVIIPARYQSQRLPGKPLADIAGKPMVQHVWEKSKQSRASHVWIATDDERICNALSDVNAEVVMTSPTHPSGTDRIAEVVEKKSLDDNDIVVNVQGDEPEIPPVVIDQVAQLLEDDSEASVATLSVVIDCAQDVTNENVVKVVTDANGYALYFSRAPIPWPRGKMTEKGLCEELPFPYHRHIGIYAYRVSFLKAYQTWKPAPIEQTECLEQLRAMWNGHKIKVAVALETPPPGIDSPEELAALREKLK